MRHKKMRKLKQKLPEYTDQSIDQLLKGETPNPLPENQPRKSSIKITKIKNAEQINESDDKTDFESSSDENKLEIDESYELNKSTEPETHLKPGEAIERIIKQFGFKEKKPSNIRGFSSK